MKRFISARVALIIIAGSIPTFASAAPYGSLLADFTNFLTGRQKAIMPITPITLRAIPPTRVIPKPKSADMKPCGNEKSLVGLGSQVCSQEYKCKGDEQEKSRECSRECEDTYCDDVVHSSGVILRQCSEGRKHAACDKLCRDGFQAAIDSDACEEVESDCNAGASL